MATDSHKSVYPLPNEASAETKRLDTQHFVFVARFQALHLAGLPHPLPQPYRVLDLGTGTGIWARQFAYTHPSSSVIGIDVSSPLDRGVSPNDIPPNCTFLKANFEDDWSSFLGDDDEKFDFIYARMLMAAVRDWPVLFRKCFAHLKPNGYLEVFEGVFAIYTEHESDTSSLSSPAIKWFQKGQAYMEKVGVKWDRALDLPGMLRNAGFQVVVDLPKKMKLAPDEEDEVAERGRIAEEYLRDMQGVVRNMTAAFFKDDIEVGKKLAEEAVEEMEMNRDKRGFYATLYVRVARKPLV